MASIRGKAISILAGNLNLGGSYLITTVTSVLYCRSVAIAMTGGGVTN
jgi:hypothetical protein